MQKPTPINLDAIAKEILAKGATLKTQLLLAPLNSAQRALVVIPLYLKMTAESKRLRGFARQEQSTSAPTKKKPKTSEVLADWARVSSRQVEKAARIKRVAPPSLWAALTAGEMTIDAVYLCLP